MEHQRFLRPPQEHFFLFGPRGTGKTSWTKSRFLKAFRIDLLDPALLRELSAKPERLRDKIMAAQDPEWVIVDEVQKLPELLEVVHSLIEEKGPFRFALTGSSSRKLRRQGVNLLGGRAQNHTLHPFMAAELAESFRLENALRYGMLPIIHASSEPERQVRDYNGLYLREEVQAEGFVRNFGNFTRFLESISFSHGSVLNLANVSRECHVSRPTVEGYLSILEDLLLSFRLPVFTKRAARQLASHPKFYFFDAGVFRANRPMGPLDSPSEIDGAALEGLVAQHLRAWCAYSDGGHSFYYWQTRSGTEVDFIVYGPLGLFALEVKNTDKIRTDDLRGLKAFGIDYPECTRVLLYRGSDRISRDGILCIPCADFLKGLLPNAFPL
jgi:predicted AAA+ superfamily ATPase